MEEEEDNTSAANSEIRFITLELMKLAQTSGRRFEEVAQDYLKNTFQLQRMLQGEDKPNARIRRGSVLRQK